MAKLTVGPLRLVACHWSDGADIARRTGKFYDAAIVLNAIVSVIISQLLLLV